MCCKNISKQIGKTDTEEEHREKRKNIKEGKCQIGIKTLQLI